MRQHITRLFSSLLLQALVPRFCFFVKKETKASTGAIPNHSNKSCSHIVL
jgi:hypothetical protein